MSFTKSNLSLYHSFSKMPAQDSTTLGNAINKSGHTVTASEVWASDIPYFGKMGSLADVVAKVQPYARKNDMCYITAGDDKGKTFQYDGVGVWTDITATLVDGAIIKNAKDEAVLLYHKGKTLTNLTADNNANTDSADNAARLWVTRDKDGSALAEGETRLVEQFVAPTDKALNGLASVAYAPSIANGTLVSGTHYYDYCFSGTILWETKRTTATVIDCFEYVGEKISDVVDTVGTHSTEIKTAQDAISLINEQLGLGNTGEGGSTESLGGRVTALETAVETLNGDATVDGSVKKAVSDAQTAIEGKSLASTSTGSDLVTVTTTGTVGEGMTTTVDTTALAQAIADAESATSTLGSTVVNSTSTTTEGNVTVTLGGTVAAPTVTVTQSDIASAQALADLTTTVNEHIEKAAGTYLGIEIATNGLDAVTKPETNKIYLVPLDTEEGREKNIYTEYIYTDGKWEVIGTTAIDLKGIEEAASALATRVSTLETTTIPGVQQTVTDLTTTVGENKAAIEKALSDAVAEIGQTTTGLDTRLTTAEGEIDTLQGQVETITSTDATKEGSIAKALADAKTYAEGQASAAQQAAEGTAAAELAAARTEITEEIAAAQQAAIDNAKVTLTQGTGIVVTPNATASNSFTVAVDDTIATVADTTALSEVIASNKAAIEATVSQLTATVEANKTAIEQTVESTKSELEGKITAASTALETAKTEIKGTTDGLDSRLTDAESAIESLTTGDSSVDKKIETAVSAAQSELQANIDALASTEEGKEGRVTVAEGKIAAIETSLATGGETANAIKAAQDAADAAQKDATQALADAAAAQGTADAAKDTADTAVQSASGDDYVSAEKEADTTNIKVTTNISAIDSKLAEETSVVGAAIKSAKEAGVAAGNAASQALETAKTQTLAQTGTLDGMFTVATTGTVGTGIETITITDSGLADAIDAAKTEGTEAKTAVTTLSTTAVAEQSVTGSGISVTLGGQVGAPTLTGSVTTATYTPATADTAGAWSDETNVVTGATVKAALTDVTNAHKKDIETLEQSIEEALEQHTADIETVTAAVNALSTSGFSRVVVTELPTENINLNAIYLIANKESDANEYIEYIYVGEVGSGRFEQIGTTKTDLAEYAKTADVTEAIATATQTTTLVTDGALTAPATADESKFVTASGIYTAITTAKSEVISSLEVTAAGSNGIELGYADGALTLTVTPGVVEAGNDSVVTGGAVATAITTAIEALDVAETTQNGITFSQTDGEVSISVAVGEVVADNTSVVTGGAVAQAITDASDAINDKIDALDATETVNGITVTQVDGKITGITEELIVASVPAETTSVEGNVAYVGDTKHVIAPEKFQTAAQMPETLTSWVADLSNLTVGDEMFKDCTGLTTFIGDLSSLTSGVDMFAGCSLTVESVEFIADTLPTVTSGTITLGNRTDAHNDAVAEIEAKGWTVA